MMTLEEALDKAKIKYDHCLFMNQLIDSVDTVRFPAQYVYNFAGATIISFSTSWDKLFSITARPDGKVFWHFYRDGKAYAGTCNVNDGMPLVLDDHIDYLVDQNNGRTDHV